MHTASEMKVSASLTGIFHKISTKHLNRYVTEFVGRYNMRILDIVDMGNRCWWVGNSNQLAKG